MKAQHEEAGAGLAAQQGHEELALRRIYLPIQMYFLDRLEGLMARKLASKSGQQHDEAVARALDRVIYSTLVDCIQQSVGEEAKAIIRGTHRHSPN